MTKACKEKFIITEVVKTDQVYFKTHLMQFFNYFFYLFKDCLRRFFQKSGPIINSEFKINIEKLNISDYGNIYIVEKKK